MQNFLVRGGRSRHHGTNTDRTPYSDEMPHDEIGDPAHTFLRSAMVASSG
jgi:hypothetical protein